MQEKAKSTRLQESVKQLNAEKARTESLLYQMIPKSVADRLREGESHANTCQASIICEHDNQLEHIAYSACPSRPQMHCQVGLDRFTTHDNERTQA